jgi:hypothetical protein
MAGSDQAPRNADRPRAQERRRVFPRTGIRRRLSPPRRPRNRRGSPHEHWNHRRRFVVQTIAKHVPLLGYQVMFSIHARARYVHPVVEGTRARCDSENAAAGRRTEHRHSCGHVVERAGGFVLDPHWKGRVLVDATKALPVSTYRDAPPARSWLISRQAQRSSRRSTPFPCLGFPTSPPSKSHTVLFISGDDAEAKKPINRVVGSRLYKNKTQMPWEEPLSGGSTGARQTALLIGQNPR